MNGKVVATFNSPIPAEIAHNYLAENGLHPFLQNEETVAVFSSMTNLVGGVKLLVPEDEETTARELLATRPEPEREPASEAIAAAGDQIDPDPDSLEESSADRDARYAFRAMILGLTILLLPFSLAAALSSGRGMFFGLTLLALPMQLYGLYLLVRIAKSGVRLSPRYRWTPLWCILLFLPFWAAVGVGLVAFVNAIDDPTAPHWRTVTIDFSKDFAMQVDLPAPSRGENFRSDTPIGPVKHVVERAFQGDCLYWASANMPVNPSPENEKDELIETLVRAAAQKNEWKITALKWIEHRSHTGVEYRMTKVEPNGRAWTGRAQMFRVGDRFLEIGLMGLKPEDTDDVRAKRFFRSLRIP
jgi:Putative prokaryotic signal transducing protein